MHAHIGDERFLKYPIKSEVQRILIISFNNIGDTILSLPVFETLSHEYPEANIDIVVGPRARIVYENIEGVNRIFIYMNRVGLRERLIFFRQLQAQKYDMVVDLKRTYFSLLGKYKTSFWKAKIGRHKRDQHLNVLTQFGLRGQNNWFENRPTNINGVEETGHIVIAPGSLSDIKRWPEDHYAELANRLLEGGKYSICWIGSQSDYALIERIKSKVRYPSINCAQTAKWSESVELIKKAKLVITNDSAPLHLADHFEKKVLSFFGPTDPVKYGAQNTPLGIMSTNLGCSPCEKAQCQYKHECMQDISAHEAFAKAQSLLEDQCETQSPRIIVFRLDRIGDILLSYPAIRALRQHYPNAKITWVTRPYAHALAERCPDVDKAISYDYSKNGKHVFPLGYGRLLKQLRRERYDMAFILHPTMRTNLLAWLSGIPYRVGYNGSMRFLLTHTTIDMRSQGSQHESKNALSVVKAFGIDPPQGTSNIYLSESDNVAAIDKLKEIGVGYDKFIVLHADASCASKRWPWQNFAELGSRLYAKYRCKIVLVGQGPSAAQLNLQIEQSLGVKAYDLTNKSNLILLAAILRYSQIVISNDSGPAHLAASVGVSTLSIFGRNQPGLGWQRWAPIGEHSAVVNNDIGCHICLADKCPIDFECLTSLSVDRVFKAAETLLERDLRDCQDSRRMYGLRK